jgi:hypothetical protein
MDMVDVFFAAAVLLLFRFSIQLAQFKSKKRNVGNGRLSCRRQRINDKLQHIGEACHGLGDEKKKISIFLKPINY